MKIFFALTVIFLRIYGAAAINHSLQYFYTASSGIPGVPEFVTMGMVDRQPIFYYESVIKKTIPKQDWMAKNEGPDYWERETQTAIVAEQVYKVSIENIKPRFNQTGGVHILQWMYGCEWDDETNKVNGYEQHGYDGEDFITFDLKTETWTAPVQQALITKNKWDANKALNAQKMSYYTQVCPDWLKKYVNYERSSLMRTVLPSVSLLQKSSSSPVTCHATGFYPNRAELIWRKDGVELHEGVDKGEILTNNDGTFQMSVDLKLSSVKLEDWERYDCVFQLSGETAIVTKLDKAVIKTNRGSLGFPVVVVLIGVLVLLTVCITVGILIKRRNNGYKGTSTSDTLSNEDSDTKKATLS